MPKTNKIEIKIEVGKDVKALLDLREKQGFNLTDFIERSVFYYHGKLIADLNSKIVAEF